MSTKVFLFNMSRNFLHYFLLKRGRYLVSATSPQKISSLAKKLYPFAIDIPLIRLGPNGDGGYLVPDDLSGIEAVFSPGVATVSEFELDCLKRGMKVFMADKSVEKPNLDIPETEYSFIKKFVGCVNNEEYITMDEWVNTSGVKTDSDLLLQMDIEGGEFFTLLDTSSNLMNRFRIMVLELHFIFKDNSLWDSSFFNLVENTLDKILQTHAVVHSHVNNYFGKVECKCGVEVPQLLEITFLRKDRTTFEKYQTDFPHELDFDNTSNPTTILPKQWHY